MSESQKRPALSPLSTDDKRQRHYSSISNTSHSSFEEEGDPDETITYTFIETDRSASMASGDIAASLKAALSDPNILELIANVVSSKLASEFASLKKQIAERDEKIRELEEKVDDLEQYSRRNIVRISGVPETQGEDTDALAIQLANAMGYDLQPEEIDRSHRVGRMDQAKGPRPLLVKMATYKGKRALTSRRSALKGKGGKVIFPDLKWTNDIGRIFINDDLTAARSRVASEARSKKKQGNIKDTWVLDGVIFVKKNNDTVHRVTCMRQLLTL